MCEKERQRVFACEFMSVFREREGEHACKLHDFPFIFACALSNKCTTKFKKEGY